ncbi:Rne/Rng family ribonuclease [candidate division KSB1 bacterium]|nr:Rne/Rng family ribonuclease [candidate division KSB1 bacterium]
MKKEIFINSSIGETRIAILEDERVVELFVEHPESERMVGDIYLGKVANVMKGMQAAFVDIGQPQDAFLHFSDIGESVPEYSSVVDFDSDGEPEDNEGEHISQFDKNSLKEGHEILVQVIKEPISKKGARLTTEISLPGRFLVLVPNKNLIGVSKKITSHREKRRLRKVARMFRPKNFGLIIRTVADSKDEKSLKADLDNLVQTWHKIEKRLAKAQPPSLVHKDMGMASSVIRDLFTNDVSRLVVDSRNLFREIKAYLKDVSPQLLDKIELYTNPKPMFDQFSIEPEIEKSLARKVWMKSGGYLIFDPTEALVAIDVNSGRFVGRRDHEQNSLRINLEAAREIARQLRLRDLGGIIVIDFIDMLEERNRKKVYDELKRELKRDRAQSSVAPISDFGLMQLTRERIRPSLLFSFSEPCPTCGGIGRVSSKGAIVNKIERWIKRYKTQHKERSLKIFVHPEVARYITDGFKSRIRKIMWQFWMKIDVIPEDTLHFDEFKVFSKKGEIILGENASYETTTDSRS